MNVNLSTNFAEHLLLSLRSAVSFLYFVLLTVWLKRPNPYPHNKCAKYLHKAFGCVIMGILAFWTPIHVSQLLHIQMGFWFHSCLLFGSVMVSAAAGYYIHCYWLCEDEAECLGEYIHTRYRHTLLGVYTLTLIICTSVVFML